MNPAEYEIMAGVEDVHWWYRGLRGLISMHLDRFAGGDSMRILDVGCGTGANLQLAGRYGRVFGLDFSDEALRLSRSRDLERLTKGNAMHLPYGDNSFDVVLLMDVLYHRGVSDKSVPLAEAQRVLKPGGIVLLNVPAYPWLMSSHDLAVHTDRRFFRGEVRVLLQDAGFRILKTSYWNMVLFPVVVLVRTLRGKKHNAESDLSGYREGFVTQVLSGILWLERLLLGVVSLPFGSSIFAAARKEH